MASLYLGTGRLEQELVRNVLYITGFGKVRMAPPEDWLRNARAYGNRASDDMWWLVQNKPQSGLTLGCFRGIFLYQVRSGGFQNKGTNGQTSLITVKSLWISWDFSQTLEPHRIMLSQWGRVSTSCDLYFVFVIGSEFVLWFGPAERNIPDVRRFWNTQTAFENCPRWRKQDFTGNFIITGVSVCFVYFLCSCNQTGCAVF